MAGVANLRPPVLEFSRIRVSRNHLVRFIGKTPADFPILTWDGFLHNLIPATFRILIGGSSMVAAEYWLSAQEQPRDMKRPRDIDRRAD